MGDVVQFPVPGSTMEALTNHAPSRLYDDRRQTYLELSKKEPNVTDGEVLDLLRWLMED